MKFVQLGTQIKTRCEKKKIYKNTQKYIMKYIKYIIASRSQRCKTNRFSDVSCQAFEVG